jgi:uncharacterized caspase-like protein
MGYKEGNIIYKTNVTKTQLEMIFGIAGNHNGLLNSYIKPRKSEVFVYYSGHGAPEINTNKAFIVPVDANPSLLALTGYPLDILYSNLRKIKAKNLNIVIEACFSGGTDPGVLLVTDANPALIKLSSPIRAKENMSVFTSCADNQVSSWYPDKGHSMFTYFFLKAISGTADKNKDRRLTYHEIYEYVSDMSEGVPYWAKRLNAGRIQKPELLCIDRDRVFIKY